MFLILVATPGLLPGPHVATFSNAGHKGSGNYDSRNWLAANDPGKTNW